MAIRSTFIRRIKIHPTVVHIHTPVYNIVTRKVTTRRRQDTIEVLGEDTPFVVSPVPPPPIADITALFSVAAGSSISLGEGDFLLNAPFYAIQASNILRISPMNNTTLAPFDVSVGSSVVSVGDHHTNTLLAPFSVNSGSNIDDIEVE